ncbi:hypothetical protein CCH79_00021141, partial [Gambusia affinis]
MVNVSILMNVYCSIYFLVLISIDRFLIPISIIFFCTVNILRALRNRFMEGLNAKKNDHKANTLVLAVLLAFLICWVPFHLRNIPTWLNKAGMLTDCSSKNIQHFCGQIFTYLAFFNSVLNPILYVIVGRNFRKK